MYALMYEAQARPATMSRYSRIAVIIVCVFNTAAGNAWYYYMRMAHSQNGQLVTPGKRTPHQAKHTNGTRSAGTDLGKVW